MSNRAAKYEQLYKSLKKHFKPLPEVGERSVLEHLIYACCLEDARADQADEAFARLQQAYFDWNEVRVTTVIELGEALNSLPNPTQAGHRIKRCLQSLFEARYQYDIEDMKKANLGKATDELAAWKGVSPFILNYVSQHALGGHAIPADTMTLDCLVQAEMITEAEAEKKSLPGIERAITKTKGSEFASLLHQFAVEFHQNAKSPSALSVFKDLGVTPKAKAKTTEKPVAEKPAKVDKAVTSAPAANSAPASKSKSTTAATPPQKPVSPAEAPTGKEKDHSPTPAAVTTASKQVTTAKPSVKSVAKAEAPQETPKKPATKGTETPKPATSKSEAPKPRVKPATKKLEEKPTGKKAESKPISKKPVETKPTKAKTSQSTAEPVKGSTKASGKEAANVKITKKKPR
jgi:endonuclease III